MTIAARTGFLGLVTNVACTQAPAGALQDAENVVLRRAGCVEPRDGLVQVSSTANPPVWGFSLNDDEDVVTYWNGSAFVDWSLVGGSALVYTDPVTGPMTPQPMRRDVLAYARSRGRVYVPCDSGLFSISATGFDRAGVPPHAMSTPPSQIASGTASDNWLANGESVAYRVVTVRKGADGLILRSIPSAAQSITNSAGADRGVTMVLVFAADFIDEVSEVELYRTRSFGTGVTVDDEMQLVSVHAASTFTLSGANYIKTINDYISPSQRGRTLYTSPSRGGIDQKNDRPPASAAIAHFKGSLFFGNVRGPQRQVISHGWNPAIGAVATGVGVRDIDVDTTNGSNQLTAASSTVGLEKGQIVVNIRLPSGTYITNISGTTITVSANATATSAAVPTSVYDAVKVGSTWYAADVLFTAQLVETDLSIYGVTPPEGGNAYTWVVETISRAVGTDTIQATHGDEFTPALPGYDDTPLTLEQDIFPGAVMWSKADEPEHVPVINYKFVGDKEKAILGLIPTRDALFVVKEDGVFRLTGSGATEGVADPWRVDPYDPTTRCILPTSVKPLNGRAYFLSNKGVVAFGDGGAEPVSKAIHDIVRDLIDEVIANFQDTGFYEVDGVVGSTAAVFERENEYTLLRNSTDAALVYNENTNAWTTWAYHRHASESLSYRGVYTLDREGRVAHALSGRLLTTRLSTDTQSGTLTLPLRCDAELSRTASAFNTTTGVVTLTVAATVLEGDVIQDAAGKLWRSTADHTSATLIAVEGPDSAFTTGACFVYRSMRCRVAPHTFYGEPMLSKDHSPLTATFSRFEGPVALAFQYSSQLTPLADDEWDESDVPLNTPLGYARGARGASYFQDVMNDHRRAWLLDAAIEWTMTHGTVRLEGVYLESRAGKQRARQQEEA